MASAASRCAKRCSSSRPKGSCASSRKGRDRLRAVAGRDQRRVRSPLHPGPRLLAQSAPHFSADDFDALDDIHRQFEKAIKAKNISDWGQLNADFHLALYVHAPQPRTRAIVLSLLQTSDRYTRLQLSNTKAMGTAEKEHAHLIALCRAEKVDEACRYLERHIEAVRKDLLQVVAIAPKGRRKTER